MNCDPLIVHRQGQSAFPFVVEKPCVPWSTCLRQILFCPEDWDRQHLLAPTDQVFKGEDAFRFCLEVVCGLHSPLIGETEVNGQFKKVFRNFNNSGTRWGQQLQTFVTDIFTQAKLVRSTHLIGLGSQSYGSLARHFFCGLKDIHILGAGHLVSKVLPWLAKDDVDLQIYNRSQQRPLELQKIYSKLRIKQMEQIQGIKGGLIIGASLPSEIIRKLVGCGNQLEVLDFRGNSHLDPIWDHALDLQSLLGKIEKNQTQGKQQMFLAKEMIFKLSQQRQEKAKLNPHGWDDLCW